MAAYHYAKRATERNEMDLNARIKVIFKRVEDQISSEGNEKPGLQFRTPNDVILYVKERAGAQLANCTESTE